MSSSHGDLEMQSTTDLEAREPQDTQNPLNAGHEQGMRVSEISVHSVMRSSSIKSSNTDVLSNGSVSYDKFVRLAAKMKTKIDEECKDWDDNDEEKTFLTSSHMVLYKWHDYMSIPRRHSFARIIFGARQKDNEGHFIDEDNHCRFMFIFHDGASMFIMFLSFLVMFGEISILLAIVSELLNKNCHPTEPYSSGNITLVPLILCTLYAGSVAAESFFRFTPFELTGQSMESYCAIAEILVASGRRAVPGYVNFLVMFGEDLKRIAERDPSRKEDVTKVMIEATLRDSSTFIFTVALQFANVLLLTTVAVVMGTSRDLIDLIQNFVSVEIVVHIHEFIPKALRLRDLSPHAFNSSFTAVGNLACVLVGNDVPACVRLPPSRLRYLSCSSVVHARILFCNIHM